MNDHEWIVEHFEELVNTYGGSYIAVVDGEVVVVGDDPKEVEDRAQAEYPRKEPSILNVPLEEDIICLL